MIAPSQGSLSARMPQSIISDTFVRNYTAPASDYSQIVAMAPGAYSVSSNGPGLGDTKTNFRAFSDKQMTIMFDGIPFNDTNEPSHHSWVFFPAQFIGGAVFDRSPGTAASIGPATFGGTIGLQSRNLANQTVIAGSGSFGSFNTRLYDAEINSGRLGGNGKASFIIDAHQMESDGYQTYNSQKRDAFMGKLRYTLTDKVMLTAFSWIIDVHSHTPNQKGPTRAQVEQFGDNFLMTGDPASPLYFGYNFYHVPTDFEYVGTRADLGHGWTFDDKVYTYRYYNKQNFNGLTTINATSATDKLNSYRKVGNLLPITQVSSRGALRAGLWSEYAWTDRFQTPSDPRTWVDAALPNFHEKFNTTTLQPYAEYQFKVVGNLSVTPGIKLAHYKLDFTQFADNGKTVGSLGGAPFIKHSVTYTRTLPAFDAHYLIQSNWSAYGQYATGASIPPTNVFDVKNAAVLTVPEAGDDQGLPVRVGLEDAAPHARRGLLPREVRQRLRVHDGPGDRRAGVLLHRHAGHPRRRGREQHRDRERGQRLHQRHRRHRQVLEQQPVGGRHAARYRSGRPELPDRELERRDLQQARRPHL